MTWLGEKAIMSHFVYCLLLLLPLSAHAVFLDCVFFDGFENAGTTDAAQLAALEVHNCARKTVDPPAATPISSLTWNTTVASQAQTWANQCTWGHGALNGYGQNVYAAYGFTPTLSDAAYLWASEEPYYNYTSNTCNTANPPNASQTCGHYTQVVWKTTTQLGCAQKYCTTGTPPTGFPSNWYFIVCDYNPPGNYIGQKPY